MPWVLGALKRATQLAVSIALASAADVHTPARPAFTEVNAYMKDVREKLHLSGAAVLVGRSDGTVLYREFFGDFTPQTVVPVASVTKWWSAATIESLAEKKLIDLDRPIRLYLPNVPADKSDLTVRQTLSHTSGLPKKGSAPYKDCGSLEESARMLLGLPLFAPPGTSFQYNGSGMQIAGAIAEKVTGRPWAEIFRDALANPLELKSTSYGDTRNPVLGGGISTSADDLGHFLLMLAARGAYHGKTVLKAASVRDLEHNVAGGARDFRSVTNGPLTFAGYNLGNWCEAEDAHRNCLLGSSYGALGTYPWVDWRRGIYGVFFVKDNLVQDEPYFQAVRQTVEKIVDSIDNHSR